MTAYTTSIIGDDRKVVDSNLHELITGFKGNFVEQETYPIEKLDAHLRNIPHLAVSIFVFNRQKLLIQKRAETKYHSGGLWANTVCTHPRWQEDISVCANRRLQEELGWNIPVRKFGEIAYHSQVGELYENEYVHCFYGLFDESHDIDNFNRCEVSNVRWLTIAEILEQIDRQPETFTEWFKIYMTQHRDMFLSIQSALSKSEEIPFNTITTP